MARTENMVVIGAPISRVFEVTNDIERWPELFEEYTDAKVLAREGGRITFQLTNKEGKSWRSVRWIDDEAFRCTAERVEPKFPFKFMNLEWLYREVPAGTEMTWIQVFEMDPASEYTDEKAEAAITQHSRLNMERIKKILEEQ